MSNLPPGTTQKQIDDHYGGEKDYCPLCGMPKEDKGGDEPVCDNPQCEYYEVDFAAEDADRRCDDLRERDLFLED